MVASACDGLRWALNASEQRSPAKRWFGGTSPTLGGIGAGTTQTGLS